ncbi:carbohydrate-binding module family 50 protein [Amanita thiersii Skay4041]|uniref:Carbohydrate-binding module family 50 protein n=1 Tax=Amanita thiersii Skay4041 TaxID=703135 RepID=A0A2A9N873_9AGAR|nr:carbohydrate-binding module family 50 protein [Amanita thiersii Skay4041]
MARDVPADCSRQYVVQAGDFCDAISVAQNVSTFQLANVNANVINADCSNLFIDETICLGIVGHDCNIVHQVQEGDSCPTIASAAGITLDTFLKNNPNVNAGCTNIYIGEVLCVGPDLYYANTTTTTTPATITSTSTPPSTSVPSSTPVSAIPTVSA